MTTLHNAGRVLTQDGTGRVRPVFSTPYSGTVTPPPDLPDPDEDVAAFVAAAKAAPYTYMAAPGDRNYNEEVAANLLVPRPDATIVKIADGNWSNAATWDLGRIPQGGDIVLIPFGKVDTFDYEMTAADVTRPLEAESVDVRVDGEQYFSETVNTRMFINTHYTDMRGYFKVGSDEVPIQADKVAKIIIQSETNLDIVADPNLQGRGIVNHGMRRFRGATKTPHLYVAAHPMEGDTYIDLESAPVGWRVGDELLLPTARYIREFNKNLMTSFTRQNEILVITSIGTGIAGAGTRINFVRHSSEPAGTGLRFDHDGPNPIGDENETRVHLANLTRNIQIISPSAPIYRLGHCIDMHTMMANIYGVEHVNLGRTDKTGLVATNEFPEGTNPVFDFLGGTIPEGGPAFDTNHTGRYPLHFHRTGEEIMGTCEYSGDSLCTCDAAIAECCVVRGTPGWGMVHHSGRARMIDNVVYDFQGAAMVAEKGDETGEWRGNLWVGARDNLGTKSGKDEKPRQTGKAGSGGWLLSRLVHQVNNQAVDCGEAFKWGMRASVETDAPLVSYFDETIPWDGLLPGTVEGAGEPQLQRMDDCGGYANRIGWEIVKRNPNQPHAITSMIRNLKFWEHAEIAVSMEYIGLYLFENVYVHGLRFNPGNGVATKPRNYGFGAVTFGTNSGRLVVKNLKVVNYDRAITPGFRYTTLDPGGSENPYAGGTQASFNTAFLKAIGVTITDCTYKYSFFNENPAATNTLPVGTNVNLYEERTIASLGSTLTYTPYAVTWTGLDITPNGLITDSVGTITRSTQGLTNLFRNAQLETKLTRDGYYTYAGKRVMLIDDVITDRALTVYDAEADRWKIKRLEFKTVVTVGISQSKWSTLGGGASFSAGTLTNLGALPSQYEAFVA